MVPRRPAARRHLASMVDVRGTIAEVNPQSRTLTVTPDSGTQNNLRNGERTVFSYNSATVVQYQGQTYQAEDLEVGDRVAARGERQGDVLWARNIDVVASVSGNPSNNRGDLRDFDATVRSVNAGNRTLEVVPFGRDGRPIVIAYDNGTRVEYEGRSYRPEDLEGGDQIHVTTHNNGDRIVAERVVVSRNVSGNGAPASAGAAAWHRSLHRCQRTHHHTGRSLVGAGIQSRDYRTDDSRRIRLEHHRGVSRAPLQHRESGAGRCR